MKKIILSLITLLFLSGCIIAPQPICKNLNQIPEEQKHEIIAYADQNLKLIQENKLKEAYEKSSTLLKEDVDEAKFKLVFAGIKIDFGELKDAEFKDLKLLNIKTSDSSQVGFYSCLDEKHNSTFSVETPLDRENQALVFYENPHNREKNLIFIHLVEEADEWKLLHFWIKKNTVLGNDADYYLAVAENNLKTYKTRNAYLNYEIALNIADFSKIQSQYTEDLRKKIDEMEVSDIPKDEPLEWEIDGEKFKIAKITTFIDDIFLKVYIVFLVDSLEDKALLEQQAHKIADYTQENFPEYQEGFAGIVVEAKTDLESEEGARVISDFVKVDVADLEDAEET